MSLIQCSSSKHHRTLWLDVFFLDLLDVFSPENAALDSEVTKKLLVAVSSAAENRVRIKVIGRTEELQLLTFCDNW